MIRKTYLRLFALVLLLVTSVAPIAWAAEANGTGTSIEIALPNGITQLDSGESYPFQYRIVPGAGGDHFHVWVDSERGPGVHTLKGSYDLPKMTAGEHVIMVEIVDKGHVPTGPEKSIKVTVK